MRGIGRATSRLPRPLRLALDWGLTIVLAIAVVLSFEAEVAKPYRIPSASMEPTLHCAKPADSCEAHFSDRVLACEICYRFSAPARGDIVVFHAPEAAAQACGGEAGVFVKRLIGLPGDTIREDRGGYVWVDGKRLDEPYVSADARAGDRQYSDGTWRVPEGKYFMMGDNRSGSCDSRAWGPVPRASVIGRVVMTYWPPTRLSVDG